MKKITLIVEALMLVCTGIYSSARDNVTGCISCDGNGVAGVSVTDGYEWAVTDANGCYSMKSDKKNGYVFYVLPSGYESVSTNVHQPQFWAPLDKNAGTCERHDFQLRKVNNDNHRIIVATDLHLAGQNDDVQQCKDLFMTSVARVTAQSHDPVYTFLLGDTSFDQFWYCNKFDLSNYLQMMADSKYPTPVYHVMGNHDNDASTPASARCDFLSSKAFTNLLGPRYYSLNLGKLHIVVLDDIVYKNNPTTDPQNIGIAGDQSYDRKLTQEQLDWLSEDLERVTDKTTPIILAIHVQNWRISTDGKFDVVPNLAEESCHRLDRLFEGFSNVNIISGHTHYKFHAHPEQYPNIHENNIAALCGSFWLTGNYSGRHLCWDGSPGGYELFDINGRDIKWQYIPVDPVDSVGNHQMRVYDMNAVRTFFSSSREVRKLAEFYPKLYPYYQKTFGNVPENQIMINVFDYDTDWKVEVIEDGAPLEVKRTVGVDPFYILGANAAYIGIEDRPNGLLNPLKTTHLFVAQATTRNRPVQVRVTDSFGRTYTETLSRPKAFNASMR
ncbi:MAG: calcineurin-like phosphoesterase C-terminal domain-containing protein [Bacteroidales bacterium]|nr:calcineurin-like phosphoesterase C-terminal domain-containing protein [Candidatus Sodaliphilus aphodohippi]